MSDKVIRSKQTLFDLEDISIFYQYLYMDKNHKIVFYNGLTDLELTMNEDLHISCRNLKFPDLPPMGYGDNCRPSNILGIIYILKNSPPVEFKDSFSSRWEEIEKITKVQLSLNKMNHKKM